MNGSRWDDGALEPQVREIAVTESVSDTLGESDRGTGGIETITTGIDFDSNLGLITVDGMEPTAGRLGNGGLFAGLLGLNIARYDSPARLTFRDHTFGVDATDPDSPLDHPAAVPRPVDVPRPADGPHPTNGSLQAAGSPVPPDISGSPVDHETPISMASDPNLTTRSTQSGPSTDLRHRLPADTTAHSVSPIAASHDPRTLVSVTGSRRQVATPADAGPTEHSHVPRPLIRSRRPLAELQSYSAEHDRSRRLSASTVESATVSDGYSASDPTIHASVNDAKPSRRVSLPDPPGLSTAETVWQPHTPTPDRSPVDSSGRLSVDTHRSVDSSQSAPSRRRLPSRRTSTAAGRPTPPDTTPPQSVNQLSAVDRSQTPTTRRVSWPRSTDSLATQPDSTHRSRAPSRHRLAAVDPLDGTTPPSGSGAMFSVPSARRPKPRSERVGVTVAGETTDVEPKEATPTATAGRGHYDRPFTTAQQSGRRPSSGRLIQSPGQQRQSQRQPSTADISILRPFIHSGSSVASTPSTLQRSQFDRPPSGSGLSSDAVESNARVFRTLPSARSAVSGPERRLQPTQSATQASHQARSQPPSTVTGGPTTSRSPTRQHTSRHKPRQRLSARAATSNDQTAVRELFSTSRRRSVVGHRRLQSQSPMPVQSGNRSRGMAGARNTQSTGSAGRGTLTEQHSRQDHRRSTSETALARTQVSGAAPGTSMAVTVDRGATPRNDRRLAPTNGGQSASHPVSRRQSRTGQTRTPTLLPEATGRRPAVDSVGGWASLTQPRQTAVSRLSTASVAGRTVDRHTSALSHRSSVSTPDRNLPNAADARQQPETVGLAIATTDRSQSASDGRRSFISGSTGFSSGSLESSPSAHAAPQTAYATITPPTNTTPRAIRSTAVGTYRSIETSLGSADDASRGQSHPALATVFPSRTVSNGPRLRDTTDHATQRRPRQSSTELKRVRSRSVGSGSPESASKDREPHHRLTPLQSTPVVVESAMAPVRTGSIATPSEYWPSKADTSKAHSEQSERFRPSDRTPRRIGAASPAITRADSSQGAAATRQSTEPRPLPQLSLPAGLASRSAEGVVSWDRLADTGRLRGQHPPSTLSTAPRSDAVSLDRHQQSTPNAATGPAAVETHRGEAQPESTVGLRHHRQSTAGAMSGGDTAGSIHERSVDRTRMSTSYDATVLSVAAMDSHPRVADQDDDRRHRAGGTTATVSGGVDWTAHSGRNSQHSQQSTAATATRPGETESETAIDSMAPKMVPARSGTATRGAKSNTTDGRPQMTFKQSSRQTAHDGDADAGDSAKRRVDSPRQRPERSSAGGGVAGRADPQPASTRRDETMAESEPFNSVDRPDHQPKSKTDQTPNRRHHHRQDTDRQSDRSGLDGSLGAESLAYDADVDRVVETLYRRLERKLRIERERTGF
ncbi:hypothetical protein halTADL_2215 [Halohasta litchfieldiae]|uniref:Uncharacterized protein n=2 Tax=Halohasta litchfieldiae TaxID=1073996 RepID=A0A1H6VC40_9EURY|nr:hypothetical protein halTADL_2215 [Halohasta litchfieldiae]SEJ01396.1 hypothetical protein SAMN05444271_11634 [Halohasta litchfieldiae]